MPVFNRGCLAPIKECMIAGSVILALICTDMGLTRVLQSSNICHNVGVLPLARRLNSQMHDSLRPHDADYSLCRQKRHKASICLYSSGA